LEETRSGFGQLKKKGQRKSMTRKKAEQITRLRLAGRLVEDTWVYIAYDENNKAMACGEGDEEKEALEELVRDNYRRVSREVMIRQGFLCGRCGERKPLQTHHKEHRSKGRLDTEENLIAVCQHCHNSAHGAMAHRGGR
jgi:hypothetical protein